MKPFVKWIGGKTQLLEEIQNNLPPSFNTYFEPFVGGGAVFFFLNPLKAVINDINTDLVYCYRSIKESLDFLIAGLKSLENGFNYSLRNNVGSEFFYNTRKLDRDAGFVDFSKEMRAARFIFINKTGFNGLWRVNKKGFCNTPFGKKTKCPKLYDLENLKTINLFLRLRVKILNGDFAECTKTATAGDFVYFDPPYAPVSKTANFTGYVPGGTDHAFQIRVADEFKRLDSIGVHCLLSNSDTPEIRELYKGFTIVEVQARRNVNSDGEKRGKVTELLIKNY